MCSKMDQLKYSEETQRIIQTYVLGREYLWEWIFKGREYSLSL